MADSRGIAAKFYLYLMATAGYSGKPLFMKLGIKPGMKILLINQPEDYIQWLGTDIRHQLCRQNEITNHASIGFIHVFVKNKKEFEREMKNLKVYYQKNPSLIIWVSWIKKAAKIPTDMTEDFIRGFALKKGLVDVKVCAVSETWSGLKLVVPLSKR